MQMDRFVRKIDGRGASDDVALSQWSKTEEIWLRQRVWDSQDRPRGHL